MFFPSASFPSQFTHLNGYCHCINKDRKWNGGKKCCPTLTTMARRSTRIYFGGKSERKNRGRQEFVACVCLISFSTSYYCVGCLSPSNNDIVTSFSPRLLCSPIIAISLSFLSLTRSLPTYLSLSLSPSSFPLQFHWLDTLRVCYLADVVADVYITSIIWYDTQYFFK